MFRRKPSFAVKWCEIINEDILFSAFQENENIQIKYITPYSRHHYLLSLELGATESPHLDLYFAPIFEALSLKHNE